MRTLSRVSTRFSTSTGLSGGTTVGDCSACSSVEIMKGISCDSTPSFARSEGVMGGGSGEGCFLLVGGRDRGLLWGSSLLMDMPDFKSRRRHGGRKWNTEQYNLGHTRGTSQVMTRARFTVGIGVKSDPENGVFMFGFEQIFFMFSLLVYRSKILGNTDWEILGGG